MGKEKAILFFLGPILLAVILQQCFDGLASSGVANTGDGEETKEGIDGSFLVALLDLSAHGHLENEEVPGGLSGQLLRAFIASTPSSQRVPISQRAEEIVKKTGGDAEAALKMYKSRHKGWLSLSWIKSAAMGAVPILGETMSAMRNLWREVRDAGFVAAMYGHDLDDPEVKLKLLAVIHAERQGITLGESIKFFGLKKLEDGAMKKLDKMGATDAIAKRIAKKIKKPAAKVVKVVGKPVGKAVEAVGKKLPLRNSLVMRYANQMTSSSFVVKKVSKSAAKKILKGGLKVVGTFLIPAQAAYKTKTGTTLEKAGELFAPEGDEEDGSSE